MRKVETDCDCCDLHVHRGANGEASRYRYNGQEYVGRAALSKAVGRPVDQIDRRIELNVCLKLSTQELKARQWKPGVKSVVKSQPELVRTFLKNMAVSFHEQNETPRIAG